MVICYTCIANGHDNIRPPHELGRCQYWLFTDWPAVCAPWHVQPLPQHYHCHGRNSRIPKLLPHLFMDCGYSLYLDGCFRPIADPRALAEEHLRDADIALYEHPRRSLAEELELCRREGIGYDQKMVEQVNWYIEQGVRGLWAGGFILRRHNEAVERFNEIWWLEYRNGCSRDQIALPYAIQKSGVRVKTLRGDILQSPYMEFMFHAKFVDLKDNGNFVAYQERRRQRKARLDDLCK